MPEMQTGTVRYASTNRPFQKVGDVPVLISPTNLLGMKTALFGMTRPGKSNTTIGTTRRPTPRLALFPLSLREGDG